jgi:hypothetical protein
VVDLVTKIIKPADDANDFSAPAQNDSSRHPLIVNRMMA